jgi:hypothetical protein
MRIQHEQERISARSRRTARTSDERTCPHAAEFNVDLLDFAGRAVVTASEEGSVRISLRAKPLFGQDSTHFDAFRQIQSEQTLGCTPSRCKRNDPSRSNGEVVWPGLVPRVEQRDYSACYRIDGRDV